MIYFLTLNPAIDTSIAVDHLGGRDVKASCVTYKIAGKALNAANILFATGIPCVSIVFQGQTGGMASIGEKHRAIQHPALMRQNFSIHGRDGFIAHIRSPFRSSLAEIRPVLDATRHSVRVDDILVIAGALPELDEGDRDCLIDEIAEIPGRLILDVSSLNLQELARLAPDTIKLNVSEFRALASISDDKALTSYDLRRVQEATNSKIVVTQGPKEVLAVDDKAKIFNFRISPDFLSSTQSVIGSGDAFLGGYAAGLDIERDFTSAVRLGTIFGVARQQNIHFEDIDFGTQAMLRYLNAVSFSTDS